MCGPLTFLWEVGATFCVCWVRVYQGHQVVVHSVSVFHEGVVVACW